MYSVSRKYGNTHNVAHHSCEGLEAGEGSQLIRWQRLDPESFPFMEAVPHPRESPTVMVDHIRHPYTGWPRNNGAVDTVEFQDFALINSHFFALLDRASIFYYNNTKVIKFG